MDNHADSTIGFCSHPSDAREIADAVNARLKEKGWEEFRKGSRLSTDAIRTFRSPWLLAERRPREATIVAMAKYISGDDSNATASQWSKVIRNADSRIRVGYPFCIWTAPLIMMEKQLKRLPSHGQSEIAISHSDHTDGRRLTARELVERVLDQKLDCIALASHLGNRHDRLVSLGRFLHSGPGPSPIFFLPSKVFSKYADTVKSNEQKLSRVAKDAIAWRLLYMNTETIAVYHSPGTVSDRVLDFINSFEPDIDLDSGRVSSANSLNEVGGRNDKFQPLNDFDVVANTPHPTAGTEDSRFLKSISDRIKNDQPFVVLAWPPYFQWIQENIKKLTSPLDGVFVSRLYQLYPSQRQSPVKFHIYALDTRAEEVAEAQSFRTFWMLLHRQCRELGESDERPSQANLAMLSSVFAMRQYDLADEFIRLDFALYAEAQWAFGGRSVTVEV